MSFVLIISHSRHFLLILKPSPSNPIKRNPTPASRTPTMATRTATASTTSPRLLTSPPTTSPRLLTTAISAPTSNPTPTPASTAWWNTNLPLTEQTPTCPSYLLYATHHQKERSNLATPDALFTRKTWPQVRSLIAANRLDQFTRVPSELRQYRKWTEKIVRENGSMMRFILEERLGWVGLQGEAEGRFGCKGTVHFHPLYHRVLDFPIADNRRQRVQTTGRFSATTGRTASTRGSCTSSSGPNSRFLRIP
jgi:hypothetical protein